VVLIRPPESSETPGYRARAPLPDTESAARLDPMNWAGAICLSKKKRGAPSLIPPGLTRERHRGCSHLRFPLLRGTFV
jgi:hypothetical protein